MAEVVNSISISQDGKFWDLFDLPDGFVIKGDLDLSGRGLEKLPDLSKVKVEGKFYCLNNRLTSLEGAPKEVGGDFVCGYNRLTSLEGAPEKVGGDFECQYNQLTSLEGAPKEVGGGFCCDGSIAKKYGLNYEFTLDELKASELYIKETKQEMIDKKAQELKYKVLRIFAKENVSPEKGVVNPKRSDDDKAVIKAVMEQMRENIGK